MDGRKPPKFAGARPTDPGHAELRRWYANVLPQFGSTSVGDLIASWRQQVQPRAFPIDEVPSGEEVQANPGRYLQDPDGQWWVVPPPVTPEPDTRGVVVLTFDGAGPVVLDATAVTHDREAALALLPDGDDVALRSLRRFVADELPSARRHGNSVSTGKPWRSSHYIATVACALVAGGLRGLGVPHREAIRIWYAWDCELGGRPTNTSDYDDFTRRSPRWRDIEGGITATNRRISSELVLSLFPKGGD